ncbi:hypothetical protein [Paractinoplanes ovalisporus]|nr:hypothetical protein [Actinoplanes ovalisporus]
MKYPNRVQIYFDDTQFAHLKETAASLGKSPADFVRGLVNEGVMRSHQAVMELMGGLLEVAREHPDIAAELNRRAAVKEDSK